MSADNLCDVWDVIISKVTESIMNNDSNSARHTSIKIME